MRTAGRTFPVCPAPYSVTESLRFATYRVLPLAAGRASFDVSLLAGVPTIEPAAIDSPTAARQTATSARKRTLPERNAGTDLLETLGLALWIVLLDISPPLRSSGMVWMLRYACSRV